MNRPLLLISASAFLLMTGLSVVFPVLPFFTRDLGLSDAEAGGLMSVYAFASVLASPFWGRFSERRGRRPALLIGLAGFSLAFGLFALGSTFWELFAARALGGLLAAAAQPAIFSYAADVSAREDRSVAMGTVGAAFGLGIIAGPVLGGALAPYGLRVPFFATAGIGLIALLAVAAFVPESLSDEIRARSAGRRDWLASRGLGMRRIALGLKSFLTFSFLFQTARMGLESTLGFLVDDRLAAGPGAVGLLLGGLGFLAAGVQGGGIRGLTRRFGDATLLRAGASLSAVGLFGLAFAHTWPALIAVGIAIVIGGALVTPTFTAELSRSEEDLQGEAQGLNQSALSLGRVVGPLLFTTLYERADVVAYLLAALLALAAFAIAVRGLRSSLQVAGSP